MAKSSPSDDSTTQNDAFRLSVFEAVAGPLQELQDVLQKYQVKDTNDTDLIGRVNALLDNLSTVVGIEEVGKVGQIVLFNPEEHRSGNTNLPTGTKAKVLIPGYRLKNSQKSIIPAVVTREP